MSLDILEYLYKVQVRYQFKFKLKKSSLTTSIIKNRVKATTPRTYLCLYTLYLHMNKPLKKLKWDWTSICWRGHRDSSSKIQNNTLRNALQMKNLPPKIPGRWYLSWSPPQKCCGMSWMRDATIIRIFLWEEACWLCRKNPTLCIPSPIFFSPAVSMQPKFMQGPFHIFGSPCYSFASTVLSSAFRTSVILSLLFPLAGSTSKSGGRGAAVSPGPSDRSSSLEAGRGL